MRYLLIVLSFVALSVWLTPQLIGGAKTGHTQSDAGQGVKVAALANTPAPKQWWSRDKKISETFSTRSLTKRRSVQHVFTMPLTALLKEGEVLPEVVYHEVFAKARAPGVLITLCPEILRTIGKVCDVGNFDVRIMEEGQVRISGYLRYIPADAPGVLTQTGRGKIVRVSVNLNEARALLYTPETREEALREAGLLCRALRNAVQNCVVTNVSLAPGHSRKVQAPDQALKGRASFAIYADPATLDKRALENAVEQALVWARRLSGF